MGNPTTSGMVVTLCISCASFWSVMYFWNAQTTIHSLETYCYSFQQHHSFGFSGLSVNTSRTLIYMISGILGFLVQQPGSVAWLHSHRFGLSILYFYWVSRKLAYAAAALELRQPMWVRMKSKWQPTTSISLNFKKINSLMDRSEGEVTSETTRPGQLL
jgi:hypothetical protein